MVIKPRWLYKRKLCFQAYVFNSILDGQVKVRADAFHVAPQGVGNRHSNRARQLRRSFLLYNQLILLGVGCSFQETRDDFFGNLPC